MNGQVPQFPGTESPVPVGRQQLAAVGLLAALACVAPPAEAWDPETHVSIVKAAFALSPAAEARVPVEYREALFGEVASPDSFDSICRYHNGPAASVDPTVEAERVLLALSSGRGPQSPYARTKSIGRYLHFVADAVVPAPIREGRAYTILDYFTLQDFILFRERQVLTSPLAASLRQAAAASQWPDESPGARSFVYRRAVNLVADALLLLPPRADAASAPDDGPVFFLLDRLRNLKGGADRRHVFVTTYDYSGYRRVEETNSIREERVGGDTNLVKDMMAHRMLQVVERVARTDSGGSSLRLLLFNNSESCQTDISLRFKGHIAPIAGSVSAGSLLTAEVRVPTGIPPAALALFSADGACAVGTPLPGTIPAGRRVVLGLSGVPRDFRGAAETTAIQASARVAASELGSNPSVQFNRAALKGLNDGPMLSEMVASVEPEVVKKLAGRLLVERFDVDASRQPWVCRLVVRNTGESALDGLSITLSVTPMERDRTATRETVLFDARSVTRGSTRELTALHTSTRGIRPAVLKIVDATSTSLPVSRPAPIQNVLPQAKGPAS
ncbi:MAG: hypothetical protein HY900_13605 [Deltaproteobacteria bacterium]|nr:hypothetical protein [Deltaproteobacteria bacterium]